MDAPDQAERRERPLVRRRRITARPARLRIRSRNPCFFFRFRLFGWYVRFTHGLLETPGPRWGPGAGARHVSVHARASEGRSLRPRPEHQQSTHWSPETGAPTAREFPTELLAQ